MCPAILKQSKNPNAKALGILGKTNPRGASSKVTRISGNQHLIHFQAKLSNIVYACTVRLCDGKLLTGRPQLPAGGLLFGTTSGQS